MAEYCLDCLNKLSENKISRTDVTISKTYHICSGCGRYRQVVVHVHQRKPVKMKQKANKPGF